MKSLKTIFYRVFSLGAAVACCISALTTPALASEVTEASYEFCIVLTLSDTENAEYTDADYQENIFLIQDSDMQYLQADFDQSTGSYGVTGHVGNVDKATRFHCIRRDSCSGQLFITGLKAGNYTLTMEQTLVDYTLPLDSIIVEVSSDSASVNSDVLDEYDGTRVNFRVNISRGFKLPTMKSYDREMQLLGVIMLSISVPAFILTLFLYKKSQDPDKSAE